MSDIYHRSLLDNLNSNAYPSWTGTNNTYSYGTLSSGDTAWMLTSTALVLLMTMPGLAIYYSGMVRDKNVLSCKIDYHFYYTDDIIITNPNLNPNPNWRHGYYFNLKWLNLKSYEAPFMFILTFDLRNYLAVTKFNEWHLKLFLSFFHFFLFLHTCTWIRHDADFHYLLPHHSAVARIRLFSCICTSPK